jgi:uncharacterized protein YjdB
MDIVKYFNDNDEAASEYLQQHFAMVNDGTHLLNWQQSPIVILHTMGEAYDDGDFSALSQGENYYRAGFIMEANGQGGGINGETPKANVLYVNLANDTLYTWNGSSFDGNGNALIVNSLDTGGVDKALSAEMGKRVAGREATDRQRIDAIVAILKKSVFTDDQSAAIAALDALANATDSVSLDKSSYLFNGISGTLTLSVSTDPAGKSVTWSSSNPSVATVNNGVVTPIAEGSTIISATTTDGKSASCTVTVQAFVVESVTIDQNDATYNGETQGTTHQLTATTSPAGGAVLWSSSNPSVATINETTGLLAIVGNGQTTITATDATRTKTDTITVTVSNMVVPSITLDQNSITSNGEEAGDTHTIVATTTPSGGTVEWTSSDDSVATVSNGVVTIQGNGSCTITASWNGVSATCSVVVTNMATPYVDFEGDTLAKQIVLASYPHSNPNEITKQEAAAVTEMRLDPQGTGTLTSPFANTAITNANWLKWFTGIASSSHSMPRLFADCASLMSVCVPEGITTVGGQSLKTNGGSGGVGSSLEVIDLPSTLTNIAIHAIYPNENTVILLRSSNCTLAYSGIESGYSIKAIYVPDDKVSNYKSASQWKGYASKIFGLSEYDPSN